MSISTIVDLLDDLMDSLSENYVRAFFVRRSHHESISVTFVVQDIFHKGKPTMQQSFTRKI